MELITAGGRSRRTAILRGVVRHVELVFRSAVRAGMIPEDNGLPGRGSPADHDVVGLRGGSSGPERAIEARLRGRASRRESGRLLLGRGDPASERHEPEYRAESESPLHRPVTPSVDHPTTLTWWRNP
jgi:hypothetical protein